MIGYNNRSELISSLQYRLGGGLVDIELDDVHYNTAIDLALNQYRQRSSNAFEESILFLDINPTTNVYALPSEIIEVSKIYRRGTSYGTSYNNTNDLFDIAFVNMYMMGSNKSSGDLFLFDAYAEYRETLGIMIAAELTFRYNRNTNQLYLQKRLGINETIALYVYNYIPDETLFKDVFANQWLSSYALCQCKLILGAARGKYSGGLPSVTGMVTLNGTELITEANAEIEKLMLDLVNFTEGSRPLPFIIG